MTPELVFSIANLTALSSWALLIVLPRRRWVAGALSGVAVPALLAALYVGLVVTNWNSSPGGFSTLANVALLFTNPWMLLAGWVHYLCFDLLIGCWEVRDAQERGVPHALVVACLLLTFMFGPAGWLSYQVLRSRHPDITEPRL
jgi:hypothetical protein